MLRLLFGGPWWGKILIAVILFTFAGMMISYEIATERDRASALAAGIPEAVPLDRFRRSADIHLADEVHVIGYIDPEYNYELVETRKRRRGRSYDVTRSMVVLFGPDDPAGSKTARSAVLMEGSRVDRFFEEMNNNYVTAEDEHVVFRLNGEFKESPELDNVADDAMAKEGLTKSSDFIFIEPWDTSRAESLAPEDNAILAVIPGGLGLGGLVFTVLGLRGYGRRNSGTAMPGRVQAASPARKRSGRGLVVAVGLIVLAVVLFVKPALTTLLLPLGVVAVIVYAALRIAGVLPGRKAKAEQAAGAVAEDGANVETPLAGADQDPAQQPSQTPGPTLPSSGGLDWSSAPAATGAALSTGLPRSQLDWSQAPGSDAPPQAGAAPDPHLAQEQQAAKEARASFDLADWRSARRTEHSNAQPTYVTRRPQAEDSFDPIETVRGQDPGLDEPTTPDEPTAPASATTPAVAILPPDLARLKAARRGEDTEGLDATPAEPPAQAPAEAAEAEAPAAKIETAPGLKSELKTELKPDPKPDPAQDVDSFMKNLVAKMTAEAAPPDNDVQTPEGQTRGDAKLPTGDATGDVESDEAQEPAASEAVGTETASTETASSEAASSEVEPRDDVADDDSVDADEVLAAAIADDLSSSEAVAVEAEVPDNAEPAEEQPDASQTAADDADAALVRDTETPKDDAAATNGAEAELESEPEPESAPETAGPAAATDQEGDEAEGGSSRADTENATAPETVGEEPELPSTPVVNGKGEPGARAPMRSGVSLAELLALRRARLKPGGAEDAAKDMKKE